MSGGNPNHGYHGQFSSGGSSSSAEAKEKSAGGGASATSKSWNPYAAAAPKAAAPVPGGLGNPKAIAAANRATRAADKFAHHAQHLPPKPLHAKAPKATPKVSVTHRSASSLEPKVPHMATPAHKATPAPKLPAKAPTHAVAAGHKAAVSPVHRRAPALPATPRSSALGLHHQGAPKAPTKARSAHDLITVSATVGRVTHPHAPVHRSPVHPHAGHAIAKKNPTPAGLRGGGTASVGFGRSSSGGGSRSGGAGGGRGRRRH
jgi:hypothetical protein